MINRKQKSSTSGQSLVEIGLVLPVLLLLVFAFLDLGRAVYYYSTIGNAVREGARYASVRPLDLQGSSTDQDEVKDVVQKYSIAVAIDPSSITFPVSADDDYVKVKATYAFDPVTPFVKTLTLTSESRMMLAPIARN
jgi:Flp pilus assembly protein TadG